MVHIDKVMGPNHNWTRRSCIIMLFLFSMQSKMVIIKRNWLLLCLFVVSLMIIYVGYQLITTVYSTVTYADYNIKSFSKSSKTSLKLQTGVIDPEEYLKKQQLKVQIQKQQAAEQTKSEMVRNELDTMPKIEEIPNIVTPSHQEDIPKIDEKLPHSHIVKRNISMNTHWVYSDGAVTLQGRIFRYMHFFVHCTQFYF